MPLVVAILAAIGMLPALSGGWQIDDYFQRVTLLGFGDSKPIQYLHPIHRPRTQPEPDEFRHDALVGFAGPASGVSALREHAYMMLDYRLWPNIPP